MTSRDDLRSSAWLLILVVGLVPLPIYVALGGGLASQILYDTVVTAALMAGLVAVRRLPRHRAAWTLIIGGHLSFLVGDVLFTLNTELGNDVYPSVGDIFYLAGYPAIAFGLAGLLRAQGPRRDVGGIVDGTIIAVGAGVVMWALLMAPVAGDPELTVLERLVSVAYPAGDLLLITVGIQLALSRVRRLTPFWLLAGSLVIMLAADLGYAHVLLHGGYSEGGLLDAGWWIAYLLIAAAVVHPRAVEIADLPSQRPAPRLGAVRLVVLASVSLIPPAILAGRATYQSWAAAGVLIVGTMVLFALVVVRLVLVNRDLEQSRRQLFHDATHDPLTGLANRSLFGHLLGASLAHRRTGEQRVALLCLDLDDFKTVNDSLGHAAGDDLLCAVADRLRAVVRAGDVVARLGGDEFAIAIDDSSPEKVFDATDRLLAEIRRPILLGDDETVLRVETSIGIAFGGSGDTVDGLLRDADIAMYLAKSRGKGRREVFRPGMRQQVLERLELRGELVEALARGEFVLHYQPIYDVVGDRVHGAEALLRWQHPTRGLVPPSRFVPLAEESGIIVEVGAWVIHEACRQARTWDAAQGLGSDSAQAGLAVYVNVSPLQLGDPGLLNVVRHALDSTDLPPSRLVLELTESAVVDDLKDAADVLMALRELGVRIALDDFGAGRTSVQHLGVFPLDIVKFDREFVTAELDSGAGILSGLLSLAERVGLDVVAEGIELEAHLSMLRAMGCRYVQGFVFSAALPSEDFAAHHLPTVDDEEFAHWEIVPVDTQVDG